MVQIPSFTFLLRKKRSGNSLSQNPSLHLKQISNKKLPSSQIIFFPYQLAKAISKQILFSSLSKDLSNICNLQCCIICLTIVQLTLKGQCTKYQGLAPGIVYCKSCYGWCREQRIVSRILIFTFWNIPYTTISARQLLFVWCYLSDYHQTIVRWLSDVPPDICQLPPDICQTLLKYHIYTRHVSYAHQT